MNMNSNELSKGAEIPVQDTLYVTKLDSLPHGLTKRSELGLGNKRNVKRDVHQTRSLQGIIST